MKFIMVLSGMLLLAGRGDQIWCGENGCGANRNVSASTPPINT